MKKLHLLFFGVLLSLGSFAQKNDPVVLTIDGEDIYASEFLYIYSKNNDNPSHDHDSLDDYMELFVNYKLKVKAAKQIQYDTIPNLIRELAQYRTQLSLPYMTDKEMNAKLVKEAYDRTTTEVRASHILIRVNPDATPKDTLAAYNRTLHLRERILGGENFAEVAKGRGGSEDPSAQVNGGDLGYFSSLQMVYPFEDAAYKTPVGEVSMPVKTRFGYHLIKVEDKRKAQGMIETAHILVLVDPKATEEDIASADKKINEIYALLEEGQVFDDLAAKYSDDKSSNNKGGILPLFGSGSKQRMVPAFEEAAFALSKNGEYSKPVRTQYGYHIIKRVNIFPIAPFSQMEKELKSKVERDMRAETTREAFIENLKKEYNYSDDAKKMLPLFYHTIGDEIFEGAWEGLADDSHHGDRLFEFKDNLISIGEFEEYLLKNQTKTRITDKKLYVESKMKAMIRERLMAYEDSRLESKYPEFKSLIKEYSDGILVFEIMQDEIWKKASNDSAGIQNYYEQHKADFTYPVRYNGDLYSCKDKATAKAVISLLKVADLSPKEIVAEMNKISELNASVKSQIFNSETTEAFKNKKPLVKPLKSEDLENSEAVAKYNEKVNKAKEKKAKKLKSALAKIKAPVDMNDAAAVTAYNKQVKAAKLKNANYKLRKFKKGINKPFENNDSYYVFDVKEILESREREFSEAKGLVTAAFQNQLEKEWLEALRKKYSIEINKENLYNLQKK